MSVHHLDILTVGEIPPVPIAISMVRRLALPRPILIVGATRLPLIVISMDKQSVRHPVIQTAGAIPRQHTLIHTVRAQARLVRILIVGGIPQQPIGTALVRALVLPRAIPIHLETRLPNRAVVTRILLSGRGKLEY